MSKVLYGKDANLNFVLDFKAKKRWVSEVESFRREIEQYSGKYELDLSQYERGVLTVRVKEFVDGPLSKSLKALGKDVPLVMNIEISVSYPLSPPFVWVESPALYSKPSNLSFGIFNGVPCLKDLNEMGWSPIMNVGSVFVSVLNALAENTETTDSCSHVNRSSALSGKEYILKAHPDWK